MGDAVELGRLIRESRLKQGMSLGQLASAVGRSSSSVRRWERGEVPPAKAIMPDLADALGLDVDELDRLRPGPGASGSPDIDVTDDGPEAEGDRHTTLEQPAVAIATGEQAVQTPAEPPVPPTPVPDRRSRGMFGDVMASLRSATQDWSGWIRGGLTVLAMVIMLVILIWALGELFEAIGDVWDSFDSGSGG